MGFFERVGDILGSNINSLLEKAEDPVKMAKYYMEKYMKDLAECKEDCAVVVAQAKAREREVKQIEDDIARLTVVATNALKDNNETVAREALVRKQAAQTNLATAKQNLEIAQAQAKKLVDVYNKLVSDIETCRAKVQNIEATAAVAKNQQKVADIMSKYGQGSTGAAGLDRMQRKVQEKLDKAEAIADLGVEESSFEDMAAKYSVDTSSGVEDELARLKAELGQQ